MIVEYSVRRSYLRFVRRRVVQRLQVAGEAAGHRVQVHPSVMEMGEGGHLLGHGKGWEKIGCTATRGQGLSVC